MPTRRRAAMLAGLLGWFIAPDRAHAAPCPIDPALEASPAAARASADERLAFLRASMRVGAHRSRIWAASWGATYGVTAVALFTTASLLDGPIRRDLYVGAAGATIGVLVRSVAIPKVIGSHRRLESAIASGASTCDTLRVAEAGLLRSAKSEAFGRSLLLHVSALVYNVGVGVLLGVALDRPLSGIRQATLGMVVGQTMIITQPVTMIDAKRRYRAGALGPPPRYLRPLTLRGGGGVSWVGRF